MDILVHKSENTKQITIEDLYRYEYKMHIFYAVRERLYTLNISIDDIVQDVIIKAWENIHTYDASKSKFNTWLSNIAKYHVVDIIRSKFMRNSAKTIMVGNMYEVDYLTVYTNPNNYNFGEYIELKSLINTLELKFKAPIYMSFIEGYSHAEISEKLNIPAGTVKTRITYGLAKLEKYYNVKIEPGKNKCRKSLPKKEWKSTFVKV